MLWAGIDQPHHPVAKHERQLGTPIVESHYLVPEMALRLFHGVGALKGVLSTQAIVENTAVSRDNRAMQTMRNISLTG